MASRSKQNRKLPQSTHIPDKTAPRAHPPLRLRARWAPQLHPSFTRTHASIANHWHRTDTTSNTNAVGERYSTIVSYILVHRRASHNHILPGQTRLSKPSPTLICNSRHPHYTLLTASSSTYSHSATRATSHYPDTQLRSWRRSCSQPLSAQCNSFNQRYTSITAIISIERSS